MDFYFDIIVAYEKNTRGIGNNNKLSWKKIPEDMNRFKSITTSQKCNVVIMGRKTYESIPKKCMPLVNRINIVVTKNKNLKYHNTDETQENILEHHDTDTTQKKIPKYCNTDETQKNIPEYCDTDTKQENKCHNTDETQKNILLSNNLDDALEKAKKIYLENVLSFGCYVIGGSMLYKEAFYNKYVRFIYSTVLQFKQQMVFDTFLTTIPHFFKITSKNKVKTNNDSVKKMKYITYVNNNFEK